MSLVIRVLVTHDHPVARNGLTQLLSLDEDIEVVGAAANGAEAVELVSECEPDVVLMDLSMPVMDGCEATRRIVASGAATRVLVLTSFSDQKGILEAIDAGAVGYMLKDSEPDELIRAIRGVARGESPLDPKVAGALLRSRSDPDRARSAPGQADLTSRELDVLKLVTEGMANKQIARRLGISEKTVKAHLTNVFQRI